MTKQEVLEYVMNTPYNTNPAVLKSLLDGIEGGEGIEEITFDTIEYDDESWDFDVVTSDTLSTTEYQFITAADEEGFSVSGVLLPESGGKHYFITGDGTIFLVEQTENGYSFVHQGFLDSQNLSSLFREAYGDKIDELGGHDAEHEVGDDFWEEATSEDTVVNPITITEANYKMWSFLMANQALSGIINSFNLTGEQVGQVNQVWTSTGDFHRVITKAAEIANVTLPNPYQDPEQS